ncbi:MAG: hypothetical protein ACRDIX_01740 [Actinomycetota bacterium]
MTSFVRRAIPVLVLALALVPVLGAGATAKVTKYTFNDVVLTDADGTEIVGEIEASIKDVNKRTTMYCGYFSDDYEESLGYYFDDSPVADPTEQDLIDFCLRWFPDRSQ